MDKLIDPIIDWENWTVEFPQNIKTESVGFPEYCASYNPSAVGIRFETSGYAEYILPEPFDVTGMRWVSISLASMRNAVPEIQKKTDAPYSISINDGDEFFVPVCKSLTRVVLPVDGYTEVTKLRINKIYSGPDYLIVSDYRASSPGIPEDLLKGIRTAVRRQRDRVAYPGIMTGTINCSAGDEFVIIQNDWSWIEKHVVIQIGEGDQAERHAINNYQSNRATFYSTFDGYKMKYDHVDSPVYISFPVEIGYYDMEVSLPGVRVWYSSPEPMNHESRNSYRVYCYGPRGAYIQRDGQYGVWRCSLEVAAHSAELQAYAARVVRDFLATSEIWVQGNKLWFDWRDPTPDTEPVEGYDIVPRSSYLFDVEVKEDVWELYVLNDGSPNINIDIKKFIE